MPRYHQKSRSHLAMLANSAGFMKPVMKGSRGGSDRVPVRGSALRRRVQKALVDLARRTLRRYLLGAALGLSGPVFADSNLHGKGFGMLRPPLADDGIARLRHFAGLRQFL